MPICSILNNHYKSPFPAINMHLRLKNVSTYTIYSDTSYIADSSTCDQLFVGTNSLVSYLCVMKTDKHFFNTLEYNICAQGKIIKLISDRAESGVINHAHIILRALLIYDCKTKHILSNRSFLNITIRHFRTLPIPLLTSQVPLPIHGLYTSFMCDSY